MVAPPPAETEPLKLRAACARHHPTRRQDHDHNYPTLGTFRTNPTARRLEQAFTQWLETGESFKVKAEQVAAYIRHQEALIEARKAEAKRIRTLAEQAENQVTRLRKYLTNQMLLSGVSRIDGVSVKVSLRKKPPRVLLNCDPSELPPEYVKVTYEPRLNEIKALLKSDAQGAISWAFLSESHEYSVTIR